MHSSDVRNFFYNGINCNIWCLLHKSQYSDWVIIMVAQVDACVFKVLWVNMCIFLMYTCTVTQISFYFYLYCHCSVP